MKLLEYLTGDIKLRGGDKYLMKCNPSKVHTILYDSTYGYAMSDGFKIVSAWAKVEYLSEFNKVVQIEYIPAWPKAMKYLVAGDILHLGKDSDRIIIKISDYRYGLLNADTHVVTILIDTESSCGISHADLQRSGYLINPDVTITPVGD